jgi:uncharacterized coiled-coil DUF342 family protein
MDRIQELKEKIEYLIKIYSDLKKENESLKSQLIASQGQNEALNNKTRNLENNVNSHDKEIDSILEKINSITD